jgi:hypothetical protein
MWESVLISPLNDQNMIVSNANMSHPVSLSVGGSLMSFCKKSLMLINLNVQCFRGKANLEV